MEEKQKYETKARITGWTLNIAIGLQVLLGSLTTGLSAVATTGKSVRFYTIDQMAHLTSVYFQAAVQTTILGEYPLSAWLLSLG